MTGFTPALPIEPYTVGDLPTLIGAVIAVAALILACRVAGFGQPAEVPEVDTFEPLLNLLPGGFAPVYWALDRPNRCALAADSDGRIAAIAPAGSHYFARLADQSWTCRVDEGRLHVAASDFSMRLDLGDDAAGWREAIARTGGRLS